MQKAALQGEPGSVAGARLPPAERAAIVSRMDAGIATRTDWTAWERLVETFGASRPPNPR